MTPQESALLTLIAQGHVAPTLLERAFNLVQHDKKGIRAINTTIVLDQNKQRRDWQMEQIRVAVRHFMGVELVFKHLDEDYWDVQSNEAAPDAIVRKLTPLHTAVLELSKITGVTNPTRNRI